MPTFSTSSRQKRLKTISFLHFWLRNVLRTTTACTFSTLFRHLNLQKWPEHVVFCTFWLGNVLRATTACTFSTSQLPKVVRHWCVLYILTWKCASRHNGVHFFDISTSKSGPTLVCFVHFDLEMCFAPQRRALFRHLNFQKWSENGVFCTFWLGNVLRATTACTFSTSQLPKVVRHWCVLYILTSKCASRHNGVHFFISHLASWVRTRRFSEPTFRPSGATNHWKNTVNRDFPTFSRICIFFLLIFSLLTLLTSAFQLSILSEVSLLNFLRWYMIYDIWYMIYDIWYIYIYWYFGDSHNPLWESLSLLCVFLVFQALERWNSTTSVTSQQRKKPAVDVWKPAVIWGDDAANPDGTSAMSLVNLERFFRGGCCNSLNSDSVLKLWQSGKILNLDSLPIWVCPRAKHQNNWGEDPAAQGKPRCLEPQSRMDPVVLHQHQNPKLVQLLDQIFTPDHHKLVEMAMSTSQGSRVIWCNLHLRTLLGRWWVASWPKPWGERIGGSTGWKSHVSIFWSLRHGKRPHWSVGYEIPINKTICSMLGLCRAHGGDGPMLGLCRADFRPLKKMWKNIRIKSKNSPPSYSLVAIAIVSRSCVPTKSARRILWGYFLIYIAGP